MNTNVKKLLSLLLAFVMVLGMLPASAYAEDGAAKSYTIVTGDTATYSSYLGVITHCTVEGATALKCKVEESGTKWTLTLPADTDQTKELTYNLTTHNYGRPANNSKIQVKFNGGNYTSVDSSDYTISFSGVPEWENGEATVTFGTAYTGSSSSKRQRAYTLNLKLDDGVNDPPALTGDAAVSVDMRINETYSADLSSIFDDPDSMDVTYQVRVNGGEAAAADAAYSYVPAEAGIYTLVFTASDGEFTSDTYTVTLNVRDNAAPVLSGDNAASASGMHGLAWTIDLSKIFTDADGDALTYTVAVNDAEAVAASASYSYTPAAAGTYTLVFKAVDVKGAESPAYTVTLEAAANPAPTLAGDAAATASVDQYKNWTYDLSSIFADNEGDALNYTVSVDGAAAVSANASYSYAANTAGEQTFVFVATDKAGNPSPEYTVTLTVNAVERTTIATGCVQKAGTFDGWLGSVTVTGPKIASYEWLGGNGHDETSDQDHTLNVQLDASVADNAVIALAYAFGGKTNQVKYSSTPPASVTLVDGQASVKLTTTASSMASWVTTRNYTINFTNKVNNLPAATAEAISADLETGAAYSIDLSQYFTDADGDALTYKVSVNGAEDVAADAAYSYTPTTLGKHVLVFKANDVWSDSTKNLTVTLNVANSSTTYDVTVTAPEGYALTFHAVSAVENGTAVTAGELTYADGVVKVPENIAMITWTSASAVGGTAQVSAGAVLNIKALTLSAKTAGDQADADGVIKVTDANGAVITVGANGIALVAAGSGYTYNAAPSSTYNGSWNAVTLDGQTVSEDAAIVMTYILKSAKSVTVPRDAEVLLYYVNNNFGGYRVNPAYIAENEDGTRTFYFACTSEQGYNKAYAYRATLNGKITKAGYLKNDDHVSLTWDENDKAPDYRGSSDAPNYSDTSGNTQLRAGDIVFMTLNATGHLPLSSTKDVGAFRLWNIIDSDTTNAGIEPDFNFNVVAGDDVVTITDLNSAYGNNWQRLTANGSGTAFVEVSFDAIHVVHGWPEGGSGGAFGHMNNYVYNASNPNTNGLIVVQTDGNAANDVTFNIANDRSKLGRQWDAEHDTYYITENTGSLTLAPTAGSGIQSVAVSNDKGASFTTLEAVDGAYTATVVPGNNIFRVTNGSGQTAYQVVRVLKLDITLENQTSPDKGEDFDPLDTVRISIRGLIAPVGKMGGIYNPQSVQGSFTDSDGNSYSLKVPTAAWTAGYIFNGSTAYFDVVIPESGQLTLNGNYMTPGGFNVTLGKHRSLTMAGVGSASGTGGDSTASVLPVIVLGQEAGSRPQLTGEDTVTTSMRLGQWYEIDLSEYFTDEDSETLTYYIMENGAEDWTALSDSHYRYFPADDGEQIVMFTALDESMTPEEIGEDTAMLTLKADVAVAPSEVTVTFSISQGVDKFYTSANQNVILQQQITVPYFDLALYGLSNYYYNPRCYAGYTKPGAIGGGTAGTQASAEGVVTPMHVYIWATEVFQLGFNAQDAGKGTSYKNGLEEYFTIQSGNAGSAYVNLWNGTNMNYYINMEYPLGCPQTGSTCDQIALYDGDVISVHFIEDTYVTGSSFAALVVDENGQYDYATDAVEATVDKGQTITLTAYQSVSDWTNYITSYEPSVNAAVSFVAEEDFDGEIASWIELDATTDSDGQIEIDTSDMAAGTYYIAVKGDVLSEASKEREAAVFKLTVNGEEEPEVPAAPGDLDGDGTIGLAEVSKILLRYNSVGELTAEEMANVDTDSDGTISLAEIGAVLRGYN